MTQDIPPPISVLMATYFREKPENLELSLDSLIGQTVQPAECVLVLDGPISDALMAVIERRMNGRSRLNLRVLPLDRSGGLARALNAGLEICRGDYIVRMDSDDIALPERIAELWRSAQEMPSVDLFCSWQYEFEDSPDNIIYMRTTPQHHDDIVRTLKWRCCISHPTIMVRKAMLDRVKGYRAEFGFLEDYDLYVRLIMAGARFHTIPEPLLKFRTGPAQRARRGGWNYARKELLFRWFCYRAGFLGKREFMATLTAQVSFRLMPPGVKTPLYNLVRTSAPQSLPPLTPQ